MRGPTSTTLLSLMKACEKARAIYETPSICEQSGSLPPPERGIFSAVFDMNVVGEAFVLGRQSEMRLSLPRKSDKEDGWWAVAGEDVLVVRLTVERLTCMTKSS